MSYKKNVRWITTIAFLAVLVATPRAAQAGGYCGATYTVRQGDTLWLIADICGVSVETLQQLNPNVGYGLYAGQVVIISGGQQYGGYQSDGYHGGYDAYQGGTDCYAYQAGGSYHGGQYPGNCSGGQYGGQHYNNYMGSGVTYVVQPGDTMRSIAEQQGIPLMDLIAANPQVWNPSLIYPGQVICLPTYYGQPTVKHWGAWDGHKRHDYKATNLYTIQPQETLKDIAREYDLTVEEIMELNPTIKRPSYIHVGMVIRLW